MAIKIIQNNKPVDKPAYPKQVYCQSCGSLLEYNQADEKAVPVTVVDSVSLDAETKAAIDKGIGFNCPVCTKIVIVG